MKFSYTLDLHDYRAILLIVHFRKRSNVNGILFISLMMCIGLSTIFTQGLRTGHIILLIILLVALLFIFFLQPKLIKQSKPEEPTTWEISNNTITIENEKGKVTSNWDFFNEIVEAKEHILLFIAENPQGFLLVPKRAFNSKTEFNKFLTIIKSNVPARKYPYIFRFWYLFILYIAYFVITILIIRQLT